LDAREHNQLSFAYRIVGDNANALKEMQTALLLSPNKEQFWIEAGALQWDIGDVKAAQVSFNTAYALGKQFTELAVYAAGGNIAAGDTAAADKVLLGAYGTTNVDSDILAVAYYRIKDWPHLIALWKARVQMPGADANTWFSLASAYYVAGDSANAIKTINAAIARYPEAAASGAAAIKQIQSAPAGQ
ncbi:MAG: hypothetical protein Q8O94_04530, partial [bacterium]|nr:hypothetical protein [bacterium]